MDVTQAYQTVNARLTQAAETEANATPRPTQPTATQLPATELPVTALDSPTPRLPEASQTPSPTAVCDRAAAGNPMDITIPDDTLMLPGQSFTKIWRLQNAGTCTWTEEYAVRFFYGAQMSAPEVVLLRANIQPGGSIDIALDMIAPQSAGIHQGNWKLRNAVGQLFGIGPNGDAPFWVRIIVQEPSTATPTPLNTATLQPTPTTTPTPTPTATITPPVQASGSITLKLADLLDLDTGETNRSNGSDLAYQVDTNNQHLVFPQGSAVLGIFGSTQPGLQQCQSATMSSAPLALESLPVGTYLCFRTDQGLHGWLWYTNLDLSDGTASLDYHTWAARP